MTDAISARPPPNHFVERRLWPLTNPGDRSGARMFLFGTTPPRVLLTTFVPRDPPRSLAWQPSPEAMERRMSKIYNMRNIRRRQSATRRSTHERCLRLVSPVRNAASCCRPVPWVTDRSVNEWLAVGDWISPVSQAPGCKFHPQSQMRVAASRHPLTLQISGLSDESCSGHTP